MEKKNNTTGQKSKVVSKKEYTSSTARKERTSTTKESIATPYYTVEYEVTQVRQKKGE